VARIDASRDPKLFALKDLQGDPVSGQFYEDQLVKTEKPSKDHIFQVEKVLKRKTEKGKKLCLVKFLFYPDKFNMWIEDANIIEGSD
jgi:hypothetical protein